MAANNEVEREIDEQLENAEVEAVEVEVEVEVDEVETEATEPAAPKGSSKLILRLTLSLLAITSAVALLLAGVNAVTAEPIAEYKAEKRAAAMEQVLPENHFWSSFDPIEITVGSSDSTVTITPMYDGLSSYKGTEGLPHALVIETYPSGYGGTISLMTCISIGSPDQNHELTVEAVRIVSHSETSGIGSKTTDPSFLDQFSGKHAGITIGSGENSIDAISGASISSKAVTAGVNEALDAAQAYVTGVINGEIVPYSAQHKWIAIDDTEGGDAR